MSIFETFLCANFQKFETFISARGAAARARAGAPVRATCGGSGSVSTRTRSSSARRSTTTATVPFPASYRAASSAATSRTPSCTMAPSCASCPNCLWSCSTRQSVCRFARCRNASGLCLQCVRKAAECALGQLQLEAEQRQRRVACVEGSLAARAGEAQCVARHRLVAHAATQARGSAARGKACAGLPGAGTPADCAAPPPARPQGCRMRTGAAADRD